MEQDNIKRRKKRKTRWNDVIFYIIIITLPLIVYIFNAFVVNFNSLKMAFEKFNIETGQMEFVWFENFKEVITLFTTDANIISAVGRSFLAYLIAVIVTTFIPIFLAFYVHKKFPGAEFFKVVLFLPSIIGGIITITLFRFIVNRLVPQVANAWFGMDIIGLTSNPETAFGTVLFYSLWLSMGGGLLVNLGAMNAIDQSVVEAGKLDGMNIMQEFWHIVMPAVYRIAFLGFITGIVSVFTADYGLYAFFGPGADPSCWTLGYYFTVHVLDASDIALPFYSAWGILISVIVVPITLLARHLIYKYGPSED